MPERETEAGKIGCESHDQTIVSQEERVIALYQLNPNLNLDELGLILGISGDTVCECVRFLPGYKSQKSKRMGKKRKV